MRVELRHLRYFIAVAEELSFTNAAQRLHIAQPPLSTQIQQLERELGVQLFDRSRRAIRLTPAGEALLVEARRLVVGVDQTLLGVQRIGRGEVGRLTLGFVPSASNTTLPAVLRAYRRSHPDVEIYLREMPPDDLVRAVHARGVDLGLLYLPFEDPALEVRVVTREPLIAALPDDHPLARRRLRVADLAQEPFILPAQHRMPGLLAQVNNACRAAGFAPRAVQKDIWLVQTILALVASGIGVALVPSSVEILHRTGVAYRPLRDADSTVELGAIWRRDEVAPVLHTFLTELLPEEAGGRGASG